MRISNGLFAFAAIVSQVLPLAREGGGLNWIDLPQAFILQAVAVIACLWIGWRSRPGVLAAVIAFAGVILAAVAPAFALYGAGLAGKAGWGFWIYMLGLGFFAWVAISLLSDLEPRAPMARRAVGILVPAAFGLWLLYLWEVIVIGFGIPRVLLPAPSQIAVTLAGATDILAADFYQTFVKSVLSGYVLGCGSGFLVALLVDKVPFLQRGLLPLGNFVSALPIVGVAPIMVMWFGFDWQSKAAVVVIMTFFPMLVNTIAGLNAYGAIERDLMRSYAATYGQTLFYLRLPNALPFIFNALKINSTLALIGAIVAEFFGTPIVGMGFRISTEVGRMNVDMVWSTIAVAAVAGSVFYGLIAMLERAMTGWHASFRQAG